MSFIPNHKIRRARSSYKRGPEHASFEDLTGRVFGSLTALEYAGNPTGKTRKWKCSCSCGFIITVAAGKLKSGVANKCASCSRKTSQAHRRVDPACDHSREYRIWLGIRARCTNPKHDAWNRYGGRGITICNRWLKGEVDHTAYQCFLADMGRAPSLQYSIDRENHNGDYEPTNCSWATDSEQGKNTSTSVKVMQDGTEILLSNVYEAFFLKHLGFLPPQQMADAIARLEVVNAHSSI